MVKRIDATKDSRRKWVNCTRCPITSEHTRIYLIWVNMSRRCKHPDKVYAGVQPTYVDCTLDDAWRSFDSFVEWSKLQIGVEGVDDSGNYYQLDKDILQSGNKEYTPRLCVFVPREVNNFYTLRGRFRSDSPIGVNYKPKLDQYEVRVSTGKGVRPYFGIYKTTGEAFSVYKRVKEQYAKHLAIKYAGLVDPRVIDALNNFEVCIDD